MDVGYVTLSRWGAPGESWPRHLSAFGSTMLDIRSTLFVTRRAVLGSHGASVGWYLACVNKMRLLGVETAEITQGLVFGSTLPEQCTRKQGQDTWAKSTYSCGRKGPS